MTTLNAAEQVMLGSQLVNKVFAGITQAWPVVTSVGGSLPLDNLNAPCVFAVSYRKLRTDYTGPCCGVRRYRDNAYQEIGFVNNVVDKDAIVTFLNAARDLVRPGVKPTVAANAGFTVTRYNQAPSPILYLEQNLDYRYQPRMHDGIDFVLPMGPYGGITERCEDGKWMYANAVPLGGTQLQVVVAGVVTDLIPSYAIGLQLKGTSDSSSDCYGSPLSVVPMTWSSPRTTWGRNGATASFDNTLTDAVPGLAAFVHSIAFDGVNVNQYFNEKLVASGTSTGAFDTFVDMRVATDFDSHDWDGGLPEIIIQSQANEADRIALVTSASIFWTAAGNHLLDSLTNTPMGAWAFDLERANYTGPCIRVRNNTTGIETDIGFSDGLLDIAAMNAALGTDGGTACVWYNQVAGGLNLTPNPGLRTEDTLQPAIPSLGGGTYLNALDFATTLYPSRQFKIQLTPGSTTKWMITSVIVFNGNTTYSVLNSYDAGSGDSGAGGSRMLHGDGNGVAVDQAGVEGYYSNIPAGIHVVTTYTDGTNIGVYLDGVVGTSVACSTPIGASGTFIVGCASNGTTPWMGGYLKAMIFWNTYSDSDRLLAETWLRDKYGTP